jgi:predicted enzyme related to lactoylglutathione lyase
MADESNRGRFIWYELLTKDPEAAKAFYTELLGWGTTVWEGGKGPYTMWTRSETPIGGLMKLPDEAAAQGAPSHWLGYVHTPDTDATVARAQELGGKVCVAPMEIPTVGRMAILNDPQGAIFAVHTPEKEMPAGELQLGDVSWHELATTDYEAGYGFYNDLFGWQKVETMDMGPAGIYQTYGRPGQTLGGMYNKAAEQPGPPAWLFYVLVDDVNVTTEKAKTLGAQVMVPPMEVPGGGWIAVYMDPQGAPIAVHHSKKG